MSQQAASASSQVPPPAAPSPLPLCTEDVARFLREAVSGVFVVGPGPQLRGTADYFGWYFDALRCDSGQVAAHCHVSMMHSRAHRELTETQQKRLKASADRLLPGKPILFMDEPSLRIPTLVHNNDGSLRRGYYDLMGTSALVQNLWALRTMICNWLGETYGEHRRTFHLSIDIQHRP